MPTKPTASSTASLPSIDPAMLARVSGGTTTNDQLTQMLTQITSSLGSLSQNNNQMDPTMMMMMMMMMGGMGGGGGAAAPPPGYATGSAPTNPIYVQVTGNGNGGYNVG
jgi:hypothetical protein